MTRPTHTIAVSALPLLAACLTGSAASSGGDGGATRDGRSGKPVLDAGSTFDGPLGISGDAGGETGQPPTDASLGEDRATPDDAPTSSSEGATSSRCTMTSTSVSCPSQTYTVSTADGSRVVLYQVPLGTAPEAGWPVVFNFQGTDIPPSEAFIASTSDLYEAYGVYYEASLTKALLDAGYAVLAPAAGAYSDVTYWETNISPYATSWSGCGDDELMKQLFSDIQGGTFGPLDASSLYATGISSGGYMTSRMALSYPGMFKALAIESGSWATCLSGTGPSGVGTCTVPSPLPAKHPPTLLMHGSLDTTIVPEWTVTAYVNALVASSVPEKEVDDANSGHQWIPEAPAAVLAWFQTYP